MELTNTYCGALNRMKPEDFALHKIYHDEHYGFPIEDDNELFCRLVLEINQAGLSWTTILKKQESFRKAYHRFNIKKVAGYPSGQARVMLILWWAITQHPLLPKLT